MKKNHGKRSLTLLALMLVFLCACPPQEPAAPSTPSAPPQESSSQQEPEKEKTSVDSIMDSYYLDDHPEVVDTFQTGLTVGRLIPRYSTDSTSKETMLELCKKLQDGEKLEGLLRFEKEYYALVYDSDEALAGSVDVSDGDFAIQGQSDFTAEAGAQLRQDFRTPEVLETAIAVGKIDPATAKLKFCDIPYFATGALLYDDTQEYFIPTLGEAMHSIAFEVGALYPIPELAAMLETHIDELFPPMGVDGFGNSYTP